MREQSDKYQILLATAHRDFEKLFAIAVEFRIEYLVLTGIEEPSQISRIKAIAPPAKLYFGEDELIRLLSELDYDLALNAITGSAGVRSTITVLERRKQLALANKESLVMAGHLVKAIQESTANPILPVDSEHSAIFQAIGKHPHNEIRHLHITASGGPFLHLPLEDFVKITREQALRHPNWSMGTKVTLDSATMFNKALEVIEAHWLFDLPFSQIKAVIHPQSVIHSMVEYIDGSFLAQLSVPDMRLPILYALSYPQRYSSHLVQTDPLQLSQLSFHPIEEKRYPLFYLGLEVAKAGGILPTVMNAANEAALTLFLDGKIGFGGIYETVYQSVSHQSNIPHPDLETIISTNRDVYQALLRAPLSF